MKIADTTFSRRTMGQCYTKTDAFSSLTEFAIFEYHWNKIRVDPMFPRNFHNIYMPNIVKIISYIVALDNIVLYRGHTMMDFEVKKIMKLYTYAREAYKHMYNVYLDYSTYTTDTVLTKYRTTATLPEIHTASKYSPRNIAQTPETVEILHNKELLEYIERHGRQYHLYAYEEFKRITNEYGIVNPILGTTTLYNLENDPTDDCVMWDFTTLIPYLREKQKVIPLTDVEYAIINATSLPLNVSNITLLQNVDFSYLFDYGDPQDPTYEDPIKRRNLCIELYSSSCFDIHLHATSYSISLNNNCLATEEEILLKWPTGERTLNDECMSQTGFSWGEVWDHDELFRYNYTINLPCPFERPREALFRFVTNYDILLRNPANRLLEYAEYIPCKDVVPVPKHIPSGHETYEFAIKELKYNAKLGRKLLGI